MVTARLDQVGKIRNLALRMGFGTKEFSDLLKEEYSVTKPEHLSVEDAAYVIEVLEQGLREVGEPTKQQIKMIHVLKNCLGIGEDQYRDHLKKNYGVSSSKELTRGRAEVLILAWKQEATRRGLWKTPPPKNVHRFLDDRMDRASAKQLNYIESLWEKVSRAEDDEGKKRGLRNFLLRVMKVSDVRFLTEEQAGKVINALKAMKSRPKKTARRG